jgi:hypothetical protein
VTIKKDVYERKKKTQNMRSKYNKNMESLRKKTSSRNPGNKKCLNQIKSAVESHSSRLEVEERISGLKSRRILLQKTQGTCKNSVTQSKDQTCE